MSIRPSAPSTAVLALLVLLLVLPADAGQTHGPGGPGGGLPPAEPGPLAAAVFGEVVAGDFTRDLALDALFLDAGLPTLAMAPEAYRTAVRADTIVTDLVALPGTGVDRAFVVGGGALVELSYDTSARDLVETTVPGVDWGGVWSVAAGSFDAGPADDLVGLSGTKDVHLLIADGDGGFDVADGFTTFLPASDVQTLDWDGDGIDEIAVETAYGIEIYDAGGGQVAATAWSSSDMVTAVLDDPARAGQRLALVVRSGINDWLMVWDATGAEAPLNLGPLGVVTAAAGDLDDDGDDELLLGLDSGPEYARLTAVSDDEQDDPAEPTFSATTFVPFGPAGRSATGNEAGLVVGDYDRDGDADVLAPATGDYVEGGAAGSAPYSEVVLVEGSSANEDEHRFGIASSGIYYPSGDADAEWTVTVVGPAVPLTTGAGQAVRMEYEVWKTPDLWEPTESDVFARFTDTLPAPGVEHPVMVVLPDRDDTDLYTVVVRQVVVEGSVVVASGPATTFVNASATYEDYLPQLGPSLASLTTTLIIENGSAGPGGGGSVGTSVPSARGDEGHQSR